MLYDLFVKISKMLTGTGLSKIRSVMVIYRYLHRILLPKTRIKLIDVQEHKMYVDIADMGVVPALIENGIYHACMTGLFRNKIKDGMVCVDVGANIGYCTLIMAGLAGRSGKVFAFEPEPNNFELLIRNIKLNGYDNVDAIQKAVCNNDKSVDLFLDETSLAGHSLASIGKKHIKVEGQSLDSFFAGYQRKINLVKIDVEGAELSVINGMDRIIRENKDLTIITEFFPDAMEKFGDSPKKLLNVLCEYGFQLYDLDDQDGLIMITDPYTMLLKKPTNLLAMQ